MTFTVDDVARQIMFEHDIGKPFDPVPGPLAGMPPKIAYRVQDAYVAELIKRGRGNVAGYKIGLTTALGQQNVGLSAPISGVVLQNRVHHTSLTVERSNFKHLRIECELAVHFKSAIFFQGDRLRPDTLLDHVDTVHAAYELLDDRDATLHPHSGVAMIADNAWNAGIVLGQGATRPVSFCGLQGTLTRNGEPCATGASDNVMGDPALALTWLSKHLALRGRRIEAGQWVMTGAIVPPITVRGGEDYLFRLADFPQVHLRII
jgi:2-keto-4-pentenoate hydratase